MHKKPRNVEKAEKQSVKIHKEASKEPFVDPQSFDKRIINENIIIYLGKNKNYIQYKNNQTGFGGATIKVKLKDGTTDEVVGPFFIDGESIKELMRQ